MFVLLSACCYISRTLIVLSTFVFLSSITALDAANGTESDIDSLITGAIEGRETGLPIPRFVSLKAKRTNMRVGPSLDHRISWVFVRPGVPVEVLEEFEVWRRIRDAEGQDGWVHHAMLSSKRTAIIDPERKGRYVLVYKLPQDNSQKTAKLASGVFSNLMSCEDDWCRIRGQNYQGWVKSGTLWGVYPGEPIR